MIEKILYCCNNKECFLIGQIFDQTLTIFRLSNAQLQHKNGQTCPMTNRYLHHCPLLFLFKNNVLIDFQQSLSCLPWLSHPTKF